MQSEIIYDALMLSTFSILIFLFIVLSIFYEQKMSPAEPLADEDDMTAAVKIFLSYASEQHQIAEELCYTLLNAGYRVFFDRSSLKPGHEYNFEINRQIRSSQLMIFLVSPHSVEKGSYTLTELKFAKEKWPAANGNLLPVMAGETEFSQIPGYLKSVTILRPEGNLVAEVAIEIENMTLKK